MVFSSIYFLCFFLPFTIIFYYILPDKIKNMFLLLMSVVFYACSGVKALPILLLSIAVNYVVGLLLHKYNKQASRMRLYLIMGVIFNVGTLFLFKYLNWIVSMIDSIVGTPLPWNDIMLPIGISFYTFQGLSYVIDVYREEKKGNNKFYQPKLINLALYISMFPQLIAGPIVRYNDINSALSSRSHSYEKMQHGLTRFTFGLAKKVLIADYLGETAQLIMINYFDMINCSSAWLGAICYTLQIYFDFSAYSDMAIGLGCVFGFEFCENFNMPYISRSITEFWRRWHISLSGWFRDYLYIPLGGNRKGNVYFHLGIVFLVTGLWHGAEWGFLIWGVWHGIFIIAERILKNQKILIIKNCSKTMHVVKALLGWLYTMFIVTLGWVLFAIVDLKKTLNYIKVMFGIVRYDFIAFDTFYFLSKREILILILAIIFCFPLKKLFKKFNYKDVWFVQGAFVLVLLALVYVKIVNNGYSPFIYFRF